MHERFTRLGIAPGYRAHARHFAALAKGWGMAQADIDAHLAFAAQLPERLSGDEIAARYAHFANERGIDPDLSGLAMSWRDEVSERGIDNLPQQASTVTDAERARIAEIRAEMGKPKGDSLYWRPDAAGEAMRDEYLALIEKREASAVRAPVAPPPAGNDVARRSEIEAAMRQGSHGPYWQGEAMQNEYRAILERDEDNPDVS